MTIEEKKSPIPGCATHDNLEQTRLDDIPDGGTEHTIWIVDQLNHHYPEVPVPLSEEEKRLLAQMEAALAADDPKLAENLRGGRRRTVSRRTAALAGVGFFVGLALLVGGLQVHPAVSIIGFVLMLVGAILAVSSWRHVDPSAAESTDTPRPSSPTGPRAEDSNFMSRMEERWRRRQDPDGY